MSCQPGKLCWEGFKRTRALALLGLLAIIFILLSFASFTSSRKQAIPRNVYYADYSAVEGKRVFQAFNCMGCHTIVGNGAYFGPDLTKLYGKVGPAWLEAFLPSAGAWPTEIAVQIKLNDAVIAEDAGVDSIDAYKKKYPDAAERIARRGGHPTMMPNLPLNAENVRKLVAFLKYTSEMNTEGWPPVPKINALATPYATPMPGTAQAAPAPAAPAAAVAPAATPAATSAGDAAAAADDSELVAQGATLAQTYGCLACHALDSKRTVGPGWGGLYGTDVKLTDGSTVKVDDAYLKKSILDPNAQIVDGYPPGTMPPMQGILNDDQISALVAYIRSLKGA